MTYSIIWQQIFAEMCVGYEEDVSIGAVLETVILTGLGRKKKKCLSSYSVADLF